MNTAAINASLVFAAGTSGVLAVGLFLKDLIFGRAKTPPARLQFARQEPESGFNLWFHRLVEQSGIPMDPTTTLLLMVGIGVAGMGFPLIILESFLIAAGGLMLGFGLPLLVLSIIRMFRVGGMRKGMPDALQILADAVHSGLTLEEACGLVARESKGPLCAEFEHAHRQFQLGHHPLSIMDRLSRRIPVPEFNVFTTAVMVHHRAGGNLSLLTQRMSQAARERQEVRGHMLAVTAGSRLSAVGMVIGSIAAMITLWFVEPEYVGAFVTHELGPLILGCAIGLQLMGVLWIWRILRTKY